MIVATRRRPTALVVACSAIVLFNATGWKVMECDSDAKKVDTFPGGNTWPLVFHKNMAKGSADQKTVLTAAQMWNDIYGATDELKKVADGHGSCVDAKGKRGVVAWDKGACYEWKKKNTVGVVVSWTKKCQITQIGVYFNAAFKWWPGELLDTALHEFGHYQRYAHNWHQLSVMGYRKNGPPMAFLTGHDHGYLRTVYKSGKSAKKPALHAHRYVLLDKIIADEESFGYAKWPTCTGNCNDLVKGDVIAAIATVGNAGDVAAKPFDVRMTLGGATIGSWTFKKGMPAHSEHTFEYKGTIPTGIAAGKHTLRLRVDPDDKIAEQGGPIASQTVEWKSFYLAAPSGWIGCPKSDYADGKVCHCGCGAADPDCATWANPVNGCGDKGACYKVKCPLGACEYLQVKAPCDDGLACTLNDLCDSGSCQGDSRDCSAYGSDCMAGVCEEPDGACRSKPANHNKACDDGAACTQDDRCSLAGECEGQKRDCTKFDAACKAGACDEKLGTCQQIGSNDGGSCDDGDPCTDHDACSNGSCEGKPRCDALNEPCKAGRCDHATGGCSLVPFKDGTICDDDQPCTSSGVCAAGSCEGLNPTCGDPGAGTSSLSTSQGSRGVFGGCSSQRMGQQGDGLLVVVLALLTLWFRRRPVCLASIAQSATSNRASGRVR